MRRGLSVLVALIVSAAIGEAAAEAATTAPGAPGVQSYFDLARKDCVGTARNDTSKVWFTVAGGMLSDTYWPNVDATNVHTLQYLVTDGSSFTDLQTRDMTYASGPSSTGMSCTVIARSTTHHYAITTTYFADPARDAVVMRVRFDGPATDQRVRPPRPTRRRYRRRWRENAGATRRRSSATTARRSRSRRTRTRRPRRRIATTRFGRLRRSRRHPASAARASVTPGRRATVRRCSTTTTR